MGEGQIILIGLARGRVGEDVRRLEATRRMMHSVEREADGSWKIADDHLDKAAAYEARRMRDRPVTVETLSPLPLEQLPEADAATWPDQELAADNLCRFRDRNLLGDREPSESTKRGKALPASRRHIAACVMLQASRRHIAACVMLHFCPRVVASRPAPELLQVAPNEEANFAPLPA